MDRQTVEIVGAMRAPTPSEWRAIRDCLVSAGATTAIIKRQKNGREHVRRITIARETPCK